MKRWCFRTDDDGHLFLIPVDLADKFRADMKKAYATNNFLCVDWVDEYRVSNHRRFSFTDPKEDCF